MHKKKMREKKVKERPVQDNANIPNPEEGKKAKTGRKKVK